MEMRVELRSSKGMDGLKNEVQAEGVGDGACCCHVVSFRKEPTNQKTTGGAVNFRGKSVFTQLLMAFCIFLCFVEYSYLSFMDIFVF